MSIILIFNGRFNFYDDKYKKGNIKGRVKTGLFRLFVDFILCSCSPKKEAIKNRPYQNWL